MDISKSVLVSGEVRDVKEYFDDKKQYNGCKMGIEVIGLYNMKKVIYVTDYTKTRHSEGQMIASVPIDVDINKYGKVNFRVIEPEGNGGGNSQSNEKNKKADVRV